MTWHGHPTVRTGKELTIGERAADILRNGMGSWTFVFVFIAGMVVWGFTDGGGIDIFPWILLNLFLSMLAGLQGAILLIAAKRADQIASEVAAHTLENTVILQELVEKNIRLTEKLAEDSRRP